MNNPSYIGAEIQYYHFNHIASMNRGYDGVEATIYVNELDMVSTVNINEAQNEAAGDVVRQLTGMPQPKEECNEW